MGNPIWPSKRRDGSVLVAARFKVSARESIDAVGDCIGRWRSEKTEAGVDIAQDLSKPPRAEIIGDSTIEVVFEGRPGSRMWKDWLVDLTRDVTTSVDGAEFDGFVDRVSGVVRPA